MKSITHQSPQYTLSIVFCLNCMQFLWLKCNFRLVILSYFANRQVWSLFTFQTSQNLEDEIILLSAIMQDSSPVHFIFDNRKREKWLLLYGLDYLPKTNFMFLLLIGCFILITLKKWKRYAHTYVQQHGQTLITGHFRCLLYRAMASKVVSEIIIVQSLILSS